MASSQKKSDPKTKRASVTGFSPDNVFDRLKALQKVPHKGDWRRATLIRIPVKKTKITWTQKDTNKMFTLVTLTPEGMENLMEKLQSASNRIVSALPSSVIEHFQLTRLNYKADNFKVDVSFSGMTKIKYVIKKLKKNVFKTSFHKMNHVRICVKNIFYIKTKPCY